jgi:diguanylate cyclase (GGDEF)-like protein
VPRLDSKMDVATSNTSSNGYRVAPSRTRTSNRKLVSFDRWNRGSDQSVENTLSTAMLASDSELGRVIEEIGQISQSLKTDGADSETVRVAMHPAVWSAVRQTLVERELRQLALTDDLTCLYNRRAFLATASHQIKLATRKSQPLMMFYCDLDNLKHINDSFGHREGDMAIIHTADALEKTFRGSDIVARLGGDEFAILALEAGSQNQEAICRRLEHCLKKAHGSERRYHLSLSVGAARFDPKHAVPLGELMNQADRAMYEQKRLRQKMRPS